MKLSVLGCYGPYPPAGGACSGYLLQKGKTSLMLDIGAGTLSRLFEKISPEELDAIYLSHLHFDHTSDLLPLRYLLEERGMKLKIYAHLENTPWCKILLEHPQFEVIDIEEGRTERIGEFEAEFYQLDHTATDYAIKLDGRFLYTGDTRPTPALARALSGVKIALADCAKPIGFAGPHMTAENALALRAETGVELLATHFSPGTDPVSYFIGTDGIVCVEEGKSYEI